MSDGESLLRAILDEPDEDVHRLVYADWLEENGDSARAEFIRAQCALARFHDEGDPFTTGLPAECLRAEFRAAWLAPLVRVGVSDWQNPFLFLNENHTTFLLWRGFVESIHLFGDGGVARFLPHAAALFRLTPVLHLRVHASYHRFPELPTTTWAPVLPSTLKNLLALPETARLRTLDLRGCYEMGEEVTRVLLAAPHLMRNIRLPLEVNLPTADVRRALEGRFGSGVSYGNDPDGNEIPF
jgi:uncharacterized protein (TIGR02996 family)